MGVGRKASQQNVVPPGGGGGMWLLVRKESIRGDQLRTCGAHTKESSQRAMAEVGTRTDEGGGAHHTFFREGSGLGLRVAAERRLVRNE